MPICIPNFARYMAPHGIRVNIVRPDKIRTPMLEAGVARSGRTVANLDALVPFGRIGEADEVAALVAFLASDGVKITVAQAVA